MLLDWELEGSRLFRIEESPPAVLLPLCGLLGSFRCLSWESFGPFGRPQFGVLGCTVQRVQSTCPPHYGIHPASNSNPGTIASTFLPEVDSRKPPGTMAPPCFAAKISSPSNCAKAVRMVAGSGRRPARLQHKPSNQKRNRASQVVAAGALW